MNFNNKHIFDGKFTYINESEDGNKWETEVKFEMELFFKNNSFSGTTNDEETKGLFEEPITVNGFIEGNLISFIVMYPHNYYFDDIENKYVVDYENEYPGCTYTGEFDKLSNSFKGQWEIILKEYKENQFHDDYLEDYIWGNWEMKERFK